MTFSIFFQMIRLPLYLTLCLLLGGATAGGHLANGVLQAIGLILIVHMLYAPDARPAEGDTKPRTVILGLAPDDRILGWLIGLFIGWLVFQMIPLPPFIWQNLPGRDIVTAGDAILGMDNVWRPISIQPGQTLFSALGLIPALAVFMLALRAPEPQLRASVLIILAAAVGSTIMGLAQLAQGSGGPAYLYDITNYNAAVGFFANSNHLATLYLAALVFCADLPYDQKIQRKGIQTWNFIRIVAFIFLLICIIINNSLAGIALTIPVTLYWISKIGRVQKIISQFNAAVFAIIGIAALVLSAIVFFTLQNIGYTTVNLTAPAERLEYYANSLSIAWGAFPFGTGQGTFRWVYNLYEDWDRLTTTYVNHAHGDFIEFFMENGLVALLLIGGFIWWFVRRVLAMISGERAWAEFMAPAAMVIAVIMAHSLVDYPIRTSAIAAIFALCVGMMARPLDRTSRRRRKRTTI